MAQELSPDRARELIPAEALAQVPGNSPAARVAAMAGGTLNRTFRVETHAGRFVLRLHAAETAVLGVEHFREARLQNAAAAAGIAPAVLYVDPQQRFMIAEYIAARVWTAADFSDAAQLEKLGSTLRRLHAVVPPISAPFDLGEILRAFSDRIVQATPAQRPVLEGLIEEAQVRLRACGSEQRAPALFHSDLHHSNILETDGRLYLIDWEYAAVGDPLFDLACVLAYYPQAEAHARKLLDASGLGSQASLSMLEHASWLYRLLSSLWESARRLAASASAGIRLPTPAD